MPSGERLESTKFPKEYWKTCTALVFVLANFVFTTASLSIPHELRNPSLPPLSQVGSRHLRDSHHDRIHSSSTAGCLPQT